MNHSFHYIGCFFSANELLEKLKPYRRKPLERTISEPHVTFIYKPNEVDECLFGTDIHVTIIGYGNDGKNEGVKVSLSSDNPKLQNMIEKIEVPHITISVGLGAEAVNTRNLVFTPISEIQITGKYGGCLVSREVVLQRREDK